MESIRKIERRAGLVWELWVFVKERKKWWLGPFLLVLLMLGLLMFFAETSVVAPFIYTLF